MYANHSWKGSIDVQISKDILPCYLLFGLHAPAPAWNIADLLADRTKQWAKRGLKASHNWGQLQ